MALGAASLLLARCGGGPGGGHADAVQLVFTSIPDRTITQQPFSVAIQARDGSGHGTGTTQGGQLVEVQLGLGASPPAGMLGGPVNVSADGDGNATFQGLSLDVPGQYTLIASVPAVAAITPVTSPQLNVLRAPIPGFDAGP
ncbi:MAG TPA: hypothetical protein VFN91_15690 [Myxococcaceae bacterium]|nr:hypothetical protein [Myxococcaceae bacterium]